MDAHRNDFTVVRQPGVPKAYQPKNLNELMSLDHVIRVLPGRQVAENTGDYAPEVYIELDEDGQIVGSAEPDMIKRIEDAGWEAMDGYSGQHGYSGPIMHVSEFVGGRMADDILDAPGLYVAVMPTGLYPAEETRERDGDDAIGWLMLRKLQHGRQVPESMTATLHRQRIR
jgi:hypothetical protein